jgi:4-coumarate--CoA ligase
LLGNFLQKCWNVQKDDVLALFAQNNIDTPAVTWGCHWAGGVVSPANPAYRVKELVHHLKDSGAKAIFTQKSLLAIARQAAKEAGVNESRIVLLGDEKADGVMHFGEMVRAGEKLNGLKVNVNVKTDLAYLVYSSGTTGLPKGVMLTHKNVVSNLCMLNSFEGILLRWERDKILSVLPYYHIYG